MTTETAVSLVGQRSLRAADRHRRRASDPRWLSLSNMMRLSDRPAALEPTMSATYRPSSPDHISSWESEMTTPNTSYWRSGRR